MRRPNFGIEISVDESDCDPSQVYYLIQADPFPGGGRYEFILDGRSARKKLGIPLGIYQKFTRDQLAECALRLNTAIECLSDFRGRPQDVKWFLNSIEYLQVDEDRIVLRGECSMSTKTSIRSTSMKK